MNKIIPLLFISFFSVKAFSQKLFLTSDSLGYPSIVENKNRSARSSTTGFTVNVQPDSLFPENRVIVSIDFPLSFDLDNVLYITVNTVFYDSLSPTNPNSRASKSIFFTQNAIDKVNRKLTTVISGLKPDTKYTLVPIYSLTGCGGDYISQTVFKTAKEPKDRQKKLLFVIDKEFQNDQEIDAALDDYIRFNRKFYTNIHFEKYYLEPTNFERNELYKKIKEDHMDSAQPLKYLFFIGSNSSAYLKKKRLDKLTNQLLSEHNLLSMNFYSQTTLAEFNYDSALDEFSNTSYISCDGTYHTDPINDISDKIMQSNYYDIAYGSLMPDGYDIPKKNYILNYFIKLKNFKKGLTTFNKSVLFADTWHNEPNFPAALSSMIPRWQNNDTITVPQKLEHGINGWGSYPTWTQDYLSKLNNNSYEICFYLGHGSPGFHYFDITSAEINNLSNLNTLIFDFYSCSVGSYITNRYLAGAYLGKGNTLFVKAYTTIIFLTVINNESPLLHHFKENEVFYEVERKAFLGDAYLFNHEINSSEVHLGDPLLQLDPPCALSSIHLASPVEDYNNQNSVIAKDAIISSALITTEKSMKYSAEKSIVLLPGFETKDSTNFLAKIEGCED